LYYAEACNKLAEPSPPQQGNATQLSFLCRCWSGGKWFGRLEIWAPNLKPSSRSRVTCYSMTIGVVQDFSESENN